MVKKIIFSKFWSKFFTVFKYAIIPIFFIEMPKNIIDIFRTIHVTTFTDLAYSLTYLKYVNIIIYNYLPAQLTGDYGPLQLLLTQSTIFPFGSELCIFINLQKKNKLLFINNNTTRYFK